MAIHAIGPLRSIEGLPISFEQRAALLDAVIGHQDVKIIPKGLGELWLIVEQIHDPQVWRKRSGIGLKGTSRDAAPRRCRPQPVDAGVGTCGSRADRLGGHQRVAGAARVATPLRRGLCGGRKGPGGADRAIACVLRCDHPTNGRHDSRRNDYWPRYPLAGPRLHPIPPIYGCLDIISATLMVYFP